jgi:nicotinamide riboside kinase
MNVAFIGCPCSGKTTTAAMVFARLKEAGVPAEILPEYARLYIAQKRCLHGDPVKLTDTDQYNIMSQQTQWETMMAKVCGSDVITVEDTWSLAAMLYMSEEKKHSQEVRDLVDLILPAVRTVFYVDPVDQQFILDPNRVHDEAQSKAVDKLIPGILREFAPNVPVVRLSGTAEMRTSLALREIYNLRA